jgi:tripartite-type tricarboxylate transporter receptor subunit TctC
MQTLQSPEMRKNLVDRGFQVIGNTPIEYGQYIRREIEVWTQIVKDNQIKPE